MPKIWLSTLQKLPNKLGIQEKSSQEVFSRFANAGVDEHDTIVDITSSEKKLLEAYLKTVSYPNCVSCHQPICGGSTKSVCRCPGSRKFQEEYNFLTREIQKAETSLNALVNAPFRQSRNAFGFASSIFGGMNLLLSNVATVSLAVTFTLLIVPAAVLGLYVYVRGKREEQKVNADAEAELFDRKINLLLNHREMVTLRYQQMQTNPTAQQKFLQDQSTVKPKPPKEKRHLLGNPFSHFLVGALATMGLAYTVVKWGVLAALVAGGPVTWIIAGALSLAVGSYFAFKRYKHLAAKVALEKQMAVLATKDNEMGRITEDLKLQNQQHRPSPLPAPEKSTELGQRVGAGLADFSAKAGRLTRSASWPFFSEDSSSVSRPIPQDAPKAAPEHVSNETDTIFPSPSKSP